LLFIPLETSQAQVKKGKERKERRRIVPHTSNDILNVTLVLNEKGNTLVKLLEISVENVVSSDLDDELLLELLDAVNQVAVIVLRLALKDFLDAETTVEHLVELLSADLLFPGLLILLLADGDHRGEELSGLENEENALTLFVEEETVLLGFLLRGGGDGILPGLEERSLRALLLLLGALREGLSDFVLSGFAVIVIGDGLDVIVIVVLNFLLDNFCVVCHVCFFFFFGGGKIFSQTGEIKRGWKRRGGNIKTQETVRKHSLLRNYVSKPYA
jgi:hypothetical protein